MLVVELSKPLGLNIAHIVLSSNMSEDLEMILTTFAEAVDMRRGKCTTPPH